jgi:hypothetical protein
VQKKTFPANITSIEVDRNYYVTTEQLKTAND